MRKGWIVLALVLALPALAGAQSVVNPRTVEFVVSPDHALVTTYILGWYAEGATDPVSEVDLGTGTPNEQNKLSFTINCHPLTFGFNYTVKVRAVAGDISGIWSEASNLFDRRPGHGGKPEVKQ